MRTTITIDDDLYAKALAMAGPDCNKADVVREAMQTYVRVQAAQRLAALGGSQPDSEAPPRRRQAPERG